MYGFDYKTSLLLGLCSGSVILMVFRFLDMPLSGIILAFIIAGFIASLLFVPDETSPFNSKNRLGASAGVILSLLISGISILYFMVFLRVGFLSLNTADTLLAAYLLIILLVTFVGGYLLGSVGGSLGSLARYSWEALNKK